ncbi:unnamed protein product [Gulo gulo]|uniref:Uncharacterized protein n=1 Tax=Gulo gulo TaxID=48420 RepID=A0A9X9LQ59_GULGU|nr:unnamed protein product [Gulo gulo]
MNGLMSRNREGSENSSRLETFYWGRKECEALFYLTIILTDY